MASAEISNHEKDALLQRILSSKAFCRTSMADILLKLFFENHIHGIDSIPGEKLEQSFGRHSEGAGSAPRVAVGRLRRALANYFQTEGLREPVKVEIPPRRYGVIFSKHEPRPTTFFEAFWWPYILKPKPTFVWLPELAKTVIPKKRPDGLPRLPILPTTFLRNGYLITTNDVIQALGELKVSFKEHDLELGFIDPYTKMTRGGHNIIVVCHPDISTAVDPSTSSQFRFLPKKSSWRLEDEPIQPPVFEDHVRRTAQSGFLHETRAALARLNFAEQVLTVISAPRSEALAAMCSYVARDEALGDVLSIFRRADKRPVPDGFEILFQMTFQGAYADQRLLQIGPIDVNILSIVETTPVSDSEMSAALDDLRKRYASRRSPD